MNILFLDYDGVVNRAMWEKRENGEWVCRYNFPADNCVNDTQAVQWLSEFCQKYDYSIVITSTWRSESNYRECLINAGLRPGIQILGRTEWSDRSRLEQIRRYLQSVDHVEAVLIVDDDPVALHSPLFIQCDPNNGFTIDTFNEARTTHEAFAGGGMLHEIARL